MGNCCASEETGALNDKVGQGEKKNNPASIGDIKKDPVLVRKKELAQKKPILLGYWKIRGLAQPLRYLLEYTEHPWEDVMYEQGDAPNFSSETWTSVKNTLGLDFPAIPYLIDRETDTKLTDPYAIMIYICSAYSPELLGETMEIKGEIDVIYQQIKDCKSAITPPCYTGQDRAVLSQSAKAKMAPIVAYLGKKTYLCGESLTFIDFYMLEQCDFV